MTSTNIYQGMAAERNSSRVLRPPGGGHTDVLGLRADPEPQQAKKPSPRNVSSIIEGVSQPAAPVPTPKAEPLEPTCAPKVAESAPAAAPKVEASTPTEPACQKAPTPVEPVKPQPEAAPVAASAPAPQRVRVPPGGFSSGLW